MSEECRIKKINDTITLFNDNIKSNLHIILALSPVGDELKIASSDLTSASADLLFTLTAVPGSSDVDLKFTLTAVPGSSDADLKFQLIKVPGATNSSATTNRGKKIRGFNL